MLTEFSLETELKNDSLVITTKGYINNVGGEKIAEEYEKNASNVKKVIIDLESSKVVNSIGISFLIEVIEKLNENNGKLVFVNMDPSIEKTFTIMGLFQFAEKSDSVEAAIS